MHYIPSGLPKDITLDGELWMARGTFDQTSQICRTTVRLGRLRTFSHFLERDSMERQWLRDQVGGQLASQDRIHAERSTLSVLRSTARARGAAEHTSTATSSGTLTSWKALKRSLPRPSGSKNQRLSKGKGKARSKSHSFSRFAVSSSFLRALFGRPSSTVGPNVTSRIGRGAAASPLVKRCPRCGRVVKRKAAKLALPADAEARQVSNRSGKPVQDGRTNADQLLSKPCSMLAPSASTHIPAPTTATSRRPHPYSILESSQSAVSIRTIPSTYTHVCRRKSKSSNEWNRIKFMVRTALNHRSSFLCCKLTQICFFWYRDASHRSLTHPRWAQGRWKSAGPRSKSVSARLTGLTSTHSKVHRSSSSSISSARVAIIS